MRGQISVVWTAVQVKGQGIIVHSTILLKSHIINITSNATLRSSTSPIQPCYSHFFWVKRNTDQVMGSCDGALELFLFVLVSTCWGINNKVVPILVTSSGRLVVKQV